MPTKAIKLDVKRRAVDIHSKSQSATKTSATAMPIESQRPRSRADTSAPSSADITPTVDTDEAVHKAMQAAPSAKSETSHATNAFSVLMSKPAARKPQTFIPPEGKRSPGDKLAGVTIRPTRDSDAFAWPRSRLGRGLREYIVDPVGSRSGGSVVYEDDRFVVIRDMYPKAFVHLLILPRDMHANALHPLVYLTDPDRVAKANDVVQKIMPMAVTALDKATRSAFPELFAGVEVGSDSDTTDGEGGGGERGLVVSEEDFMVGIHVNPSMAHVHLHVISRDLAGRCIRHKAHYNSFTTDFFVTAWTPARSNEVPDAPLTGREWVWDHDVRMGWHSLPLRDRKTGRPVKDVPTLKQLLLSNWRTEVAQRLKRRSPRPAL
ncbi:aprataxin-like protein [Savitreella phatthalungensis]